MNHRSVTRLELNERLHQNGHRLWTGDVEDSASVDVFPPSDIIVTVALNLDDFHGTDFRDRYFATLVDDDRFPLLQHDPDFSLPELFDEASQGPKRSHGAFMAGPLRWLIHRLIRFPHLLLWPEKQIRSPDQFMRDHWVLDEMPQLKEWLRREPSIPPDAGALVLDTTDASDCRVFWEVAEQAEASFYNYFVSDPDTIEVYQLHHHSKVIVSIADDERRHRLLRELSDRPDLIEDCSGFTSEMDDPVDE